MSVSGINNSRFPHQDTAHDAKRAFFADEGVQAFLREKGLDPADALRHSFFVQGRGSDNIIVNFQDGEQYDPTTVVLQPDDPLHHLALEAMTGRGRPGARPLAPPLAPQPLPARETRALRSPERTPQDPLHPVERGSDRRPDVSIAEHYHRTDMAEMHRRNDQLVALLSRQQEQFMRQLEESQRRWMEYLERRDNHRPREEYFARGNQYPHEEGAFSRYPQEARYGGRYVPEDETFSDYRRGARTDSRSVPRWRAPTPYRREESPVRRNPLDDSDSDGERDLRRVDSLRSPARPFTGAPRNEGYRRPPPDPRDPISARGDTVPPAPPSDQPLGRPVVTGTPRPVPSPDTGIGVAPASTLAGPVAPVVEPHHHREDNRHSANGPVATQVRPSAEENSVQPFTNSAGTSAPRTSVPPRPTTTSLTRRSQSNDASVGPINTSPNHFSTRRVLFPSHISGIVRRELGIGPGRDTDEEDETPQGQGEYSETHTQTRSAETPRGTKTRETRTLHRVVRYQSPSHRRQGVQTAERPTHPYLRIGGGVRQPPTRRPSTPPPRGPLVRSPDEIQGTVDRLSDPRSSGLENFARSQTAPPAALQGKSPWRPSGRCPTPPRPPYRSP